MKKYEGGEAVTVYHFGKKRLIEGLKIERL